jgi:Uma2 family endonuclease
MTGEAAGALEKTYAEYLAIEAASETKHEWVDGCVYAMSGGTIAHNQLGAQMIMELGRLVEGRRCRVLTSDQRTRPRSIRFATYPDVTVVRGKPITHEDDPHAIVNPLVLVEVLSDGTERWDRTGKFRRYRKLESLKHYVLVSQHDRCIEVYTRGADNEWVLREATDGETIALSALEGVLDVDRVYRDVELTPSTDREDVGPSPPRGPRVE